MRLYFDVANMCYDDFQRRSVDMYGHYRLTDRPFRPSRRWPPLRFTAPSASFAKHTAAVLVTGRYRQFRCMKHRARYPVKMTLLYFWDGISLALRQDNAMGFSATLFRRSLLRVSLLAYDDAI